MYHATKILEDKAKIDFEWNMTDQRFAKMYNEAMYWNSIYKDNLTN